MSHENVALLAPRIAIIGLTGSGKTVLAVALVKHLGNENAQGILLEPENPQTHKFVEASWQRLQDGEWPASTPQGQGDELSWRLRVGSEASCSLRLVDLSGQDLKRLFEDGDVKRLDELEPELRAVGEYCESAAIVIVVVNLRDFMGEMDGEARAGNQAAIKAALDHLGQGDRRVCVVIGQADLYDPAARAAGNWKTLLKNEAFWIYDFVFVQRRANIEVVSAVRDTQVDAEESEKPRRSPQRQFRSYGIDRLAAWLAEQVGDISKKYPDDASEWDQRSDVDEESHDASSDSHLSSESIAAQSETTTSSEGCWGYVVFFLLALVVGGYKGCKPGITEPRGEVLSFEPTDIPGGPLGDDCVNVEIQVRNNGASGPISATAFVYQQGHEIERKTKSAYVKAEEVHVFQFELCEIYDVKEAHEVKFDVSPH